MGLAFLKNIIYCRHLFEGLPSACVWAFLLLAGTGPAAAGNISIQTDLAHSVDAGSLNVRIDIFNKGDEPAFQVRAGLAVFGRRLDSERAESLPVGKTRRFNFRVSLPAGQRGTFPLSAELFFEDARQHPYSTLSCALVAVGEKKPAGLTGIAWPVTEGRQHSVRVRVLNAAPRARTVAARIFLPQSLNTAQYQKKIELFPRHFGYVDFPISYRYGVNDATYPVFCTLEFDEDRRHHTAIVRSAVQIVRSRNWLLKTRWYWLAGLPVILLAWIGVWRGVRRRA